MERGREKRLPDGTPQRSGGSIDPECRRPPARNALFYSFATQSPSSLFSRFYPLSPPPLVHLFLLMSRSSPILFPFFLLSSQFSSILLPLHFLKFYVFLVTPIYYISLLYLLMYLYFWRSLILIFCFFNF